MSQDNFGTLARRGTPTAAPQSVGSGETLVQEYRGIVDVIEDGTAFLTLEDEAGNTIDAEYDAEQLSALGFSTGDPFTCGFYRTPSGVRLRFQPRARRELTEEEQAALREKWAAVSDAL